MTWLRSVSRQRAHRNRTGALVLIVVLATAMLLATPPAHSQPRDGIPVTIVSVAPHIATPQSEVVIEVEVTNPATTDLNANVTLNISRVIMQERQQVSAWLAAADDDDPGSPLVSEPVTIRGDDAVKVRLTVPPGELGLLSSPDGLGPRGISVTVDGIVGDVSHQLGIARTFLIWQPQSSYEVPIVDVAIAAPITGNPAALITDTAEEGRLSRVVSATVDFSGVSWLIDPALVAAAEGTLPAAALPQLQARTSDETKQWAATVRSDSGLHSSYALEPFDADVTVIGSEPAPPSLSKSLRDTLDEITQYWGSGITLPRENVPRRTLIERAWTAGSTTVIARRNYQAVDPDDVSPGGVTTVQHANGASTVLVADPILSKTLTNPRSSSPAAAAQEVLAQLVVIARNNPDRRRNVLISLPRSWEPDVTTARAQLTALESADFVNSVSLDEFAAFGDDGTPRNTPRTSATESDFRLTPSQWSDLVELADKSKTFAQIATDPSAIAGPIADAVWQLTSVQWLDNENARNDIANQLNDQVDRLLASQSVVLGSDVNLIAASSALPITVANSLDQPVTVGVRLVADHPRLKSTEIDPVEVAPHSEVSVDIPVTAVGSGDVDVLVRLLSADGTVVSTPASFTVRVRADWESRGTIIIGALLTLMLIAGIWRTIKRGRASTRTSQGPTPQEPAAQDLTQASTSNESPDDEPGSHP
ncbi:hypothetical protein SAMN06309944_1609 [Micrococcales bacterium KH10]|nr:hypothetical protein SAMN06309944_1609 [Micrococcales bacterium KH10]